MVQWRCSLCFAVVAASVAASLGAIIRKNWQRTTSSSSSTSDPPPEDGIGALWRSCWPGVRPAWLLAFRATAVVALAAVLLWDLRTYDPSIMMYYTEWTLLLEIAYFAVATLCSAHGWLKYYSGSRANQPESNAGLLCRSRADEPDGGAGESAGRLRHFMQIVYQVSAGAVVLTDVVFWGLIVPFMSSAHFSLNAVMGCIHSFNLVFLLIETALNTLAFLWFRIAYFILWTCLYVIAQWIAHACGLIWWPYPFLSPASSWAPLWYFAMALLHFPCYLVYWWIVREKSSCLHKLSDCN
ncbi:uncharacterized protein LOC133902982 [Phragmites australis]|uniref:uncharacterized protein LOC133902982 n=1 Tax=Phragmites australis TaxID=29695 RepID=UPI002D79AC35|nr:uncharacterized protein LOC133902982 [Phragmites australis]